MNLNFIQDNDKIHVQTQNQAAYKQQIILKLKLLRQDFQDYSQINPSLIDINNNFSQIVKDLYEHVTNFKNRNNVKNSNAQTVENDQIQILKKKKKISIPYGTIRKLQSLKQKFIICRKIIENQNKKYYSLNMNRENQKRSQVRFYKQVLYSYQKQRQYYKKQTLELEDKVQQVEAVVKTLPYNQNHQFTDHKSKIISFEQIFKYEKKISAFNKVLDEIKLIISTKQRIKKELYNIKQQQIQDKNKVQKNDETKFSNRYDKINNSKNYIKSIIDMQKKINLLKIQKIQIIQSEIYRTKNSINKLKIINQRLKKGILQYQNQKYFKQIQNNILLSKSKIYQSKKIKKINKITNTDYMIYLKQLNNQVINYFKIKQIVYRSNKSSTYQIQSHRSKSANFYQLL